MRHIRHLALFALAGLLLATVGGCGGSRASGSNGSVATAGSTSSRTTRANYHQADTDNDGRISINELTAYIQAWKVGTYDDINLVTNAIGLWKGGEAYHYDSSVTPPYVADSGGSTNPYKWTLMVFLDANQDPNQPASNLEPEAVLNVNQMEKLPDSNDVAIVVLMSRIGASGGGTWTGARRFRVKHDTNTSLMSSARTPEEGGTAENLGTVDMGDWNNVKAFFDWCQTNYAADHYAAVLWDHGSGTLRSRSATRQTGPPRSILFDDASGNAVTTPQLSQALNTTKKLDLVLLDACNMQMLEVAYQIRNCCDVVVGSEESTPGRGYPYDQVFAVPVSNPTVSAETFASATVTAFTNYYASQDWDSTQSALRTSQLANLASVVKSYGTTLNANATTYANQIRAARSATQNFGGTDTGNHEGYRDLIDFVKRVASTTGSASLATGRDSVTSAVNLALIANGKYGASVSGANGVAIWCPSAETFSVWSYTYSLNAFAQYSSWTNWMRTLYGY